MATVEVVRIVPGVFRVEAVDPDGGRVSVRMVYARIGVRAGLRLLARATLAALLEARREEGLHA